MSDITREAAGGRPRAVAIDRHEVMRVLWRLIAVVVALGIVYVILADWLHWNFAVRYLQFLDLDSEKSLPAWFSSWLLLAGAGLAATHAWVEAGRDDRQMARYWTVLAIIFVYLSLDEEAAIHEKLSLILHRMQLPGFLHFSWMLVVAPLLLAGGLYFIPFLRRLSSPIGWRIFVAGCVYVAAAIGMEMVAGLIITNYGRSWLYYVETVIEEGGEMVGAALFISAQLLSLERCFPPTLLRFIRHDD